MKQVEEINLAFRENLKKYLNANDMTGQLLAEVLGVNEATFRNWQSGRSYPKYNNLVNIARAFNITVDELICNHNDLKKQYGKSLASPSDYNKSVYGDDYLSQLTNADKAFVMKFRMLNQEDRKKLDDFLNELNGSNK